MRLACLAAIALGCGSCAAGNSHPPTYPVQGFAFFEGKPVPGARIVFHSLEASGEAPRPHAQVQADGSFRLSTYRAFDGAPAGRYAVIVYWRRPNPVDDEEEGPNLLPVRYLSPDTAGLQAEVRPEANRLEPFYLTK